MPYNFMDKVLKYLAVTLFLLTAGIAIVQTVRLHTAELDKADAEIALATARQQAADKRTQYQAQVRQVDNSLQASADQTREQINEATQSIAAQRDALLERVRLAEAAKRQLLAAVSKATSAPSDAEAVPVGSGTQLLATIGSADVDEAARAERVRVALVGCYKDYETARAELALLQHD